MPGSSCGSWACGWASRRPGRAADTIPSWLRWCRRVALYGLYWRTMASTARPPRCGRQPDLLSTRAARPLRSEPGGAGCRAIASGPVGAQASAMHALEGWARLVAGFAPHLWGAVGWPSTAQPVRGGRGDAVLLARVLGLYAGRGTLWRMPPRRRGCARRRADCSGIKTCCVRSVYVRRRPSWTPPRRGCCRRTRSPTHRRLEPSMFGLLRLPFRQISARRRPQRPLGSLAY